MVLIIIVIVMIIIGFLGSIGSNSNTITGTVVEKTILVDPHLLIKTESGNINFRCSANDADVVTEGLKIKVDYDNSHMITKIAFLTEENLKKTEGICKDL